MRVELGQRVKSLADVRTHGVIRILFAAIHNRCGDQAMVGIGQPDALRGIEGGEQQAIDGNREAGQKLSDIAVA